MSAVLEETREWAAKTRQRIEEIDKTVPEIEQQMAQLSEQKQTLQDERRRISPLVKSLESVVGENMRGRSKNGGARKASVPKPRSTRQPSDDELLAVIGRANEPMATRAVAKELGVDARTIRHKLPQLATMGKLAGDRNGWTMPMADEPA